MLLWCAAIASSVLWTIGTPVCCVGWCVCVRRVGGCVCVCVCVCIGLDMCVLGVVGVVVVVFAVVYDLCIHTHTHKHTHNDIWRYAYVSMWVCV